jgi:ParB family chromosome partitioning protein
LLNLPDEVLSALRSGEIEYTKAQALARVKDEQPRTELLEMAIAQNLSLGEIKTRIKELKPESESPPAKIFAERLTQISKRLHKSKAWSDQRKRSGLLSCWMS